MVRNVLSRIRITGPVLFALLIAMVQVVVLSGCGESSSSNPTQVAPTTEASASEPEVESVIEDGFFETSTAEIDLPDGTTADVTIEVGRLLPFGDAKLPAEFSQLAAACNAESERDAVIPVRMRIENTTDGFAGRFRLIQRFTPRPHLGEDEMRRVATSFSETGPKCEGSERVNMKFELEEGGVGTQDTAVVLDNYFNPSEPEGDTVRFVLTEMAVAVNSGQSISNLEVDGPHTTDGNIYLLDAARH